jgi:ABC-type branched-subunit amino acid transport system ATPase component
LRLTSAESIDEANPGTILEVEDLCVAYGKVEALHHVNIKVGEGQIVTVIGPNGAGKTTMLSSIMGVLHTRAGSSGFRGRRLATQRWSRWLRSALTWYLNRARCLVK